MSEKKPEWTTTPPTESGFYWRVRKVRFQPQEYSRPGVVRVFEVNGALWDDFGEMNPIGDTDLMWYPERIPEPPTPGGAA